DGLTWNNASSREIKRDFLPVDPRVVLEKLSRLPIESWIYDDDGDSARHLGPVAEDFKATFDLGNDGKSIATVDADGVALVAVQGLYQIVQEKDEQIATLQHQVENLNARLARLEAALAR